MKIKKLVLVWIGIIAVGTAAIWYGSNLFQKHIFNCQAAMCKRVADFNQNLYKVTYDRDMPFEYKMKIVEKYPEIVDTDPDNKFPNAFVARFLKSWKKKLYDNEQQRFYAMIYVGEGLYKGDVEKFETSIKYWNKTEMSEKKRKQLDKFLEAGRKYIAEMKKGEVTHETQKELSERETVFFGSR